MPERRLRVVITVRRDGEPDGVDLEVPADIPVDRLGPEIARALGWHHGVLSYRLHVSPPGMVLDGRLSFAQAGVWDGAICVLQPDGEADGPLAGWRPLDIDVPR